MVDEGGRHAMEAADMGKAAPESGKENPRWNVGIVAKKATGRASARRSAPIRINPDRAKPKMGIGSDCTMPSALKEPRMDRALPS